jgi:hypothetical protein
VSWDSDALRKPSHVSYINVSGHFFFDMGRLTILIVLLTIGCKPTGNSVTGTYSRYWGFENHSKLTLNDDNTFKLETQEGLVFFQTSGIWTIDKNGVTLRVKDNEGAELPGAPVYVYTNGQEEEFSADRNGEINIKKEKWDSIKVSFVGFNPLTINRGQENQYDIKLNLTETIGFKLKNERWTIRNRKIFDPRFKDKRRRNVYRKNAR